MASYETKQTIADLQVGSCEWSTFLSSERYVTILAEFLTFPGTFSFVKVLVLFFKLIPPEDFLCFVAATGVSLLAREQAKDVAL